MKVSFVSILTTAAILISTVQCTSYNLWSAERRSGRVKCIPYNQQQRESVMGNVDRMIKIWVNSDSKQSHYDGKANPSLDLDTFRKTYAGMTDEQFNLGLARIFNKMRDGHALFYKAGPYGCFSVSTGLIFKFVDDSLGSSAPPKVRVWYDQNQFILGFGANDSGGHRGAFKYLEEISGNSNILPEDDSITFQLRRLDGNQELYTVTVPYVALSNDECWSLSSSLYEELNSIALPEMPVSKSFKQKRSVSGNDTSLLGDSTLHRRDADIHRRSYWGSVQFEDTKIDGLLWTIWKNRGRNMGVIRIDSFSPVLKDTKEVTNFMFLIATIRELLVKQLKDTDSVLFDVRGNTGGLISAADGIIQLFKPDATASQFRYLKNEVTKNVFYNGAGSKSPWSKAWDATSDISRYSGFGSMDDSSTFNTFGQAYFNPVGVYTNGACYSACEIFAAHIQDHGIGTVFGEDETTGGGGASVLSSDDDYFIDRPLEYITDPFKTRLTGKNPSHKFYTRISVGARQLIRSGKYAGQLVEDDGVKSNVIVRSTVDDILPGDKGISAYDRISGYLGDVAKRQMDGLHNHLITFIGTKQGKQMFKTYREIIRVSASNDQINMMTVKSYTVSGPSSGVGVYNFASTSAQDGWNFNDGRWIIGDDMFDYSGYMSSTVRVWLSAPVGSRISVLLDATVDTYEDGGHFSLDMMDDSGEIVPMLSSTSENGLTQYKSITGRNRVIKGTYSFTVTTRMFALNMGFVSYTMESPFSVKINSIVLTKN
ncbi:hypothetical protein BASA61_008579 [Batrachochytrium salamandrivorans]|nr:hypothetical protein BASA61_008579 [Batrachochytrium salamandrivorans]